MADDNMDQTTQPEAEQSTEQQVSDTAGQNGDQVDRQNGTTALENELEECRAKANEYLDGWQRARAEFANYKRRMERDQAQMYQNASGSIIKRFLDVLDDLELALKNRPQEGEGAAWADGIELVARKFASILESEGVKVIEANGEFNPNVHEAITHEPHEDYESGQVIDVVKNGYMLGDKVLRPAVVRVAK
jgi:molecular chaperone GrpE